MTDPIADMLTRIRNAITAGYTELLSPSSRLRESILTVLKLEGYIRDFVVEKSKFNSNNVKILLKFLNNGSVLSKIERVSKPGCRVYSNYKDMPKYRVGLGIYIVSTSRGVITDHVARSMKLGGEVLCRVF